VKIRDYSQGMYGEKSAFALLDSLTTDWVDV
jgi:hypothetical protein